MSSVDGARSLQSTSDEIVTYECGPCGYGDSDKDATHLCEDCQDYLCGSCAESHKGLKITRNHKLTPVSDVTTQVTTDHGVSRLVLCECSQHAGVVAYCEDHKEVMCQSCQTVKHRKCRTVPIAERSKSYSKSEFDSIARKVNTMEGDVNHILADIDTDFKNFNKIKEENKRAIATFTKDLREFLDLLEQNALKELETQDSLVRQEIQCHRKSCTEVELLLKRDVKLLDDVMKSSQIVDMYATDVRVSSHMKSYESFLRDIRQESKPTNMVFEGNKDLNEIRNKFKTLGKLRVENKRVHMLDMKSFIDMKIESYTQVNVKLPDDGNTPSIHGCAFLSDDRVLLCDQANCKVKLLSSCFELKDCLRLISSPRDIAAINDRGIVSLPDKKQLQFVDVEPRLHLGRVLQLDKRCFGVEASAEEIYVTCHNYPGKGEVRVLDMNGNLLRRIGLKYDESFMFREPYYLSLCVPSGRLYISDGGMKKVTCLKSDSSVLFEYTDKDLVYPRGVCSDNTGNLIICDQIGFNITVVSADGKRKSHFCSSKFEQMKPYSIAYRHSDEVVIVGYSHQNKLAVYNVK